jgi:hypothetical protein
VKIYVTDYKTWNFDWTIVRDEFPEEYKMDKDDGLSDQEFVQKTFYEMGDNRFSDLVGWPEEHSECEIVT